MTDETLTEDERELLLMVAACYSPRPPGCPEPWEAILAHYRKAKAGSFESKPETPVYTAADGTLWVEDPDGTHGWWSAKPGSVAVGGDAFGPRERGDDSTPHGTWGGNGCVLRFYRRVEKR